MEVTDTGSAENRGAPGGESAASFYGRKGVDDWVRLFASRDEMAWEYARWILNEFTDDWRQINAAIIRRWSESGLLYIKRKAWAIVREDDV